jgi:hypothetical protein
MLPEPYKTQCIDLAIQHDTLNDVRYTLADAIATTAFGVNMEDLIRRAAKGEFEHSKTHQPMKKTVSAEFLLNELKASYEEILKIASSKNLQPKRLRLFYCPKQKQFLVIDPKDKGPVFPDWIFLITDSEFNIEKFLLDKRSELVLSLNIDQVGMAENIYDRIVHEGRFHDVLGLESYRNMIAKNVKFIVERQDGEVTTWIDVLDEKVEDILKANIKQKGWENGNVLEAYIEFDAHGGYYKVYLDCKKLTKILKNK